MDATTFFLTYPRSDFEFQELYEFLASHGGVSYCRIAKESHEDGSPHVHALVKYSKRVRSRDNRLFDFNGRHPNIQSARSPAKVLAYLSKEGNFCDFGTLPTIKEDFSPERLLELAKGNDRDSYDCYCLAHRVSLQWADRKWNEAHVSRATIYEASPGTECLFLQVLQFDGKTHVVIGPSGCGKTTWATRVAPKPALLVSHIDDLKEFNPSIHKSIIFDDMDFRHWPDRAQVHLLDWHHTRSINVKHSKAQIPKETPKLFTCNYVPFADLEEIKRRYHLSDLFVLGAEWTN